MANKQNTQSALPASHFDGGLLGLIGTGILAFLALLAGAAVAAGIVVGAWYVNLHVVAALELEEQVLLIVFYGIYGVAALIALIALCCGISGTTTITTRWYVRHTVINGKRLRFTGTAMQLFGNWVKWILLTIITLGIYGLWVGIKYAKWEVKHTEFEDQTPVAASTPVQNGYPMQQAGYPAQQPGCPLPPNGYFMPPVFYPPYPPVPPCGYNGNYPNGK